MGMEHLFFHSCVNWSLIKDLGFLLEFVHLKFHTTFSTLGIIPNTFSLYDEVKELRINFEMRGSKPKP